MGQGECGRLNILVSNSRDLPAVVSPLGVSECVGVSGYVWWVLREGEPPDHHPTLFGPGAPSAGEFPPVVRLGHTQSLFCLSFCILARGVLS